MHVSFVRPHSIYMNKKCINHAVWEPWALSHRHQRCNKQQSRRWKHHGFTAPTGYVIYFALSKSLISCSHVWKIRITKKIKHLVLDPQEVKHYLPASWKACTSNPPRIHKQHEPIVGSAPTKAAEWKISHIYMSSISISSWGKWMIYSSWCLKQIWSWCILRTGIRIVPEEKFLILPSTGTLR